MPVISVAGTIGEETAVELLKLGAADYVSKDHLARLPYAVGRALEAASDHRARLAAEAALRASETRYRRMVETAAEGIVVVDEDFAIVFSNERMATMLGIPAGRAGRQARRRSARGRGRWSSAATRRSAAAPASPRSTSGASAGPTARELWVNVSASPIFDDDGDFAGSLAMIADISEQRDAEGRLKQALAGTVAAMGALVEMRDPYTAGHERRDGRARRSPSPASSASTRTTVETLDLTARMHDIGQIAVPAEILTRPGRLSQNEFTLVKAHPQVAYDILSSIDFGRPIADVILQHHERLDGSGYPNGVCRRRDAARGAHPRRGRRRRGDVLAPAVPAGARRRGRPRRDRGRRRPLYDAAVVAACEQVVRRGLRLQELRRGRTAARRARRGAIVASYHPACSAPPDSSAAAGPAAAG